MAGSKKDSQKMQPAGLPRRAGRDQRLAMYIVISKPKRMSLAAGFSHFMLFLLCINPASRGSSTCSASAGTQIIVHCFGELRLRENADWSLMISMRLQSGDATCGVKTFGIMPEWG